jgi:hypothetical protein
MGEQADGRYRFTEGGGFRIFYTKLAKTAKE